MIDIFENIKCPYCENKINLNLNKYIVGSTSSEKDMGMDIQLIIESNSFFCPVCKNDIAFYGTVGIYPEDVIEFIDIKVEKVFNK